MKRSDALERTHEVAERTPPKPAPEPPVIALQRTAGNRAVTAMLMRGGVKTPQLDVPTPEPPKVPEGDPITVGIELFAASQMSQTEEGKRILGVLQDMHGKGEIGLEDLSNVPGPVKHPMGITHEGCDPGFDMGIDQAVAGDIVDVTLTLVHEAVHFLYKEKTLDEEIRTRNAEIDYYTELQGGVTVRGVLCQVSPGWDESTEEQREKRGLDQLIDYIVSIYWGFGDFDAAWVETHIDDWGGIQNRWTFTKSQYVLRLLGDARTHAESLLRLLESVSGNKAEFTKLVDWVGGEDKLAEGLEPLYRTSEYRERVEDLQETTGFELVLIRP